MSSTEQNKKNQTTNKEIRKKGEETDDPTVGRMPGRHDKLITWSPSEDRHQDDPDPVNLFTIVDDLAADIGINVEQAFEFTIELLQTTRKQIGNSITQPQSEIEIPSSTSKKQAGPNLDNLLKEKVLDLAADVGINVEQAFEFTIELLQITRKRIRNIKNYNPFNGIPGVIQGKDALSLDELKNSWIDGSRYIYEQLEEAQGNPNGNLQNYRKASRVACNLLRYTLKNEQFFAELRKMPQLRDKDLVEYLKLVVNDFSNFLEKERELLESSGVPNVDELIKHGRKAIEAVSNGGGHSAGGDSSGIYVSLGRLRDASCQLESELKTEISAETRGRAKRILKKTALSFGAGAVAVINVQAGSSGALTPPQSALSGHIAAGIIGAAAADAWSLING